MSIEEKIKELKIELPKAPDPVGSYVATKQVGNLLYISGQISIDEDGNLINSASKIYVYDTSGLKNIR